MIKCTTRKRPPKKFDGRLLLLFLHLGLRQSPSLLPYLPPRPPKSRYESSASLYLARFRSTGFLPMRSSPNLFLGPLDKSCSTQHNWGQIYFTLALGLSDSLPHWRLLVTKNPGTLRIHCDFTSISSSPEPTAHSWKNSKILYQMKNLGFLLRYLNLSWDSLM